MISQKDHMERLRCPMCGSWGPFLVSYIGMREVGDDASYEFDIDTLALRSDGMSECKKCGHSSNTEVFRDSAALADEATIPKIIERIRDEAKYNKDKDHYEIPTTRVDEISGIKHESFYIGEILLSEMDKLFGKDNVYFDYTDTWTFLCFKTDSK